MGSYLCSTLQIRQTKRVRHTAGRPVPSKWYGRIPPQGCDSNCVAREAGSKLFYLTTNNISKKWTMPRQDWKGVLNCFTIDFEERMTLA